MRASHNRAFIDHATTGFEEYARRVEAYTLGARRGDDRRAGRR